MSLVSPAFLRRVTASVAAIAMFATPIAPAFAQTVDASSTPPVEIATTTDNGADTTAPVITLLGDDTVDLTVGDTYADAGATALDNVDGDLTSKIATTGTVDTSVAGTSTIAYDVSDAAGNKAAEVTRTVVVNASSDASTTPPTDTGTPAPSFMRKSSLGSPSPVIHYYVDTVNGSDSNDGSAADAAHAFKTLEKAVSVANGGDTIDMTGTESIVSTGTPAITVSKAVTIDGQNSTTLNVSGGPSYALLLTGGATIKNFTINKTDAANQNVIGIQANNVTISGNTFTGTFNIGNSETTRAIEVSSVSGLTIDNNHITHFRQPAYINDATGTVSNNYVADTKGWVVVSESDITFTGNTWGAGSDQNVVDIAIIADNSGANPSNIDNYAGHTAAMSAANSNARIDEQVTPPPPPPVLNGENFNTVQDSTYTGISIGFDAKNFDAVSAVTVDMTRADGSHVIKHGDQGLFDLLSHSATAVQATAPFVITEGTYHQATDVDSNGHLYWQVSPAETWNDHTQPVSVTITVTDENGAVSVTIPGPLSQGAPSWPAYADMVPALAPSAPTITGFTQDGHTLACGAVTNDAASVSINWSAAADSLYQFAIVPNYPDNHGEYTYYPPGSATSAWIGDNFANAAQYHGEGVYSYTMTSQGANHLWSAPSAPCTLTYDKTAPVVTVSPMPADGSLSATTAFTITINDANPATSTNSSVYVYLYNTTDGSQKSGSKVDLSSGTGTFTVDTTALADGTYNLDVGLVKDAAGNPTRDQYHPNGIDSYFRNYVINNVPPDTERPTLVFNEPATGSTASTTLPVSVTAADAGSGLATLIVHFYNPSGTFLGSCGAGESALGGVADSAYTCSLDTSALADGTYSLRAGTTDVAGNNKTVSMPVVIDNTRPNATITAPASGALTSGSFTITGTATDNLSGIDHVVVYVSKVLAGGGFGGYVVNNQPAAFDSSTGAFTYDVSGLADGSYTIKADAFDAAGNNHFASPSPAITIDSTAPTTPANGQPNESVLATNNFDFTWDASTDASGPVTYEYQATQDPTETGGVLTNGLWHSPVLTGPAIHSAGAADGVWYWQVRAKDAAGNYSDWSPIWDVTLDTTAPDAPALFSPADGATVNGASVTQEWSDADPSVDHYVYESYNDAAATSVRFTGTYPTTSKTVTNIADTTYWWRVAAVDAAGNQSSWSPLWKLTVDNASGSGHPTDTPPVADNQSVEAVQGEATDITLTGSDADGDAFTFTTTAPSHGTLVASSTDPAVVTYTADAGYTGTDSFTFTANDGTQDSAQATVTVTVTVDETTSGGGHHTAARTRSTGGGTSGGSVLGAETFNFTRDLTIGSTGDDVTALQQILMNAGLLNIPAPTGYFGPLTRAALGFFQALHSITPAAGYFGPITRALLNSGTF